MPQYRLVTLVDITRTNADRDETDQLKIFQQSNFNSLIQAIGLRSNVDWQDDPTKTIGRLPVPFDGKGAYWEWKFFVERDEVFVKENDPVGLLKDDLYGVPVIDNLENTIKLEPCAFISLGDNINIHVEVI